MKRLHCVWLAGALLTAAVPLAAAAPPVSWDGLAKVESKRLKNVYLRPGTDFAVYTKVKIDPPEVAFQKNWLRDYNRDAAPSARIRDAEAAKALNEVSTGFESIFAEAYRKAGYQIVTEPGLDVLRLRTGVIDLSVAAPDKLTAGRTRTFSIEAGAATLVIEARDSVSGALLGRAVDRREAGTAGPRLRTSVSNRADFERLFRQWADASVRGLAELKALSPGSAEARLPQPQ